MNFISSPPINRRAKYNTFVQMSTMQRMAVVAFVLLYNALIPGFSEVLHQPSLPLAAARFASEALYQALLLFPFIYFKPGFGWFHPVIFTVVWSLVHQYAAVPEQLLLPIMVFLEPIHPDGGHVALKHFTEVDEAWTYVKASGIQSLSLVAYYIGFFSRTSPPVPRFNVSSPKQIPLRASLLVAGAVTVFLVAVQTRGGAVEHFLSLATGRPGQKGLGYLDVLIRVGVVASIVWYAFDRNAGKNPFYWGVLGTSLVSIFVWTGSRSDVIYPLSFLLILHALRYKKIPWWRGAVLGATALILFGMLGALRASTTTGRPAWELLTDLRVSESLEYADEQLERREKNPGQGYTAVIGRVPRDVGFLYGRPYLTSIFFFVPRGIWEEKPVTVGQHVNEYLYGTTGNVEMEDVPSETAGKPAGNIGAVYWNFYIPGVLILFGLFGVFHRWLARLYERNENPVGAVFFLYLLIDAGLSPGALTTLFQDIVLLLAVLTFVRAIRPFQTVLRRML